ncbi:unnamed protein product [Penicillium salamii]|nr:unnamed protein product [Penicillium salamii]CAG8080797.1 unnamed protein product [Penicillium salamii]CAG8374817.1 unnamed protein product [Penicillium salamii]
MAIDQDGDSTMTSSVDSIRPDESARAGARTPTGTDDPSSPGLNRSELSPPGSQAQGPGTSVAEQRTLESRPGPAAEPVASWNTKRAQEDYQRAMEFVVDRDFSLRMSPCLGVGFTDDLNTNSEASGIGEFGDPFDDRELHEKL